MKSKIFHSKCPCCGESLVVDMQQRRIDSRDPTKKRESSLLDDAPGVLESDNKRAGASFDQAFADEQKKKPSFEDFM